MRRLVASPSFWIAVVLLAANGAAWAYALAPEGSAVTTAAVLEPQIAEVRQKLIDGGHSGEAFSIELTDREAAETIAWYLSRHPNVPFHEPQVFIRPDGITARGVAVVAGLRVGVSGRARIALDDGVPIVTVADLDVAGIGVPGLIRDRIQAELDAQFRLARDWPVRIDTLSLQEGQVLVSGEIR